ncbi:hypothetical protein IQ06DRAFT_11775 [Phaeosphaeriaceae sp. SRC1lsM3a]|nr:hypothetical protein IQ06DRAFT_11775 [Stagonospora sp. SRC1lsM3a]
MRGASHCTGAHDLPFAARMQEGVYFCMCNQQCAHVRPRRERTCRDPSFEAPSKQVQNWRSTTPHHWESAVVSKDSISITIAMLAPCSHHLDTRITELRSSPVTSRYEAAVICLRTAPRYYAASSHSHLLPSQHTPTYIILTLLARRPEKAKSLTPRTPGPNTAVA